MSDLIQTPDSAWESIIEITSKIQSEILSAQSFKDLLLMLRDKGLPIPLTEISIVYKKYGTAKSIFLVSSGEIVSKKDVRSDTDFSADLPAIKDIINNNSNEPVYLETQNACMEKGFPDQYKSLLLIPLKISDIRNIGVFIVHSSSKENAYTHLKNPLAALSKRLAFYLYINFITRRANSFKSFKNELLQTTFNQEHEIIEFLLKQLKKWFSIDKVNILLIDPFSIDEYFFACKDSEVIQDYRNIKQNLEDTSKLKEIIEYLEQPSELAPTTNYNSWLGAKMAIASDQNVGYILLENNPTEVYTAWERELVSDIAGFAALFLTEFRKNLREKSILTVKDLLLADTLPSDKCLYQKAQDELNKLYGTVPLAIVRINRTTRGLELTDTTIQEFSLDADFIKELANYIETTGKLNINELPVDELKNRLTIDHPKLGRLIAAPMRSGGDELGCFIVLASNCDPLTARYIEDLSDMIAVILDKKDKTNFDLLLTFGYEVAKIKKITKEEIIKITQQYTSKAMYSENLYIALYDKQKNEISFPYIVKDGKPLNQPPRPLNQAKRGKTEEIIITEQPILHKTKQEAQAWYDEPNHEEFLGDALASWIGVPIITSEGVIGVIATYHTHKEHSYTQANLFFLQQLSLQVSGLFRALALEDTNRKLEEAMANNTKLKEANRKLEEARIKEAETANTMSQLQEKTRHLTLKETDSIKDDLVDALICTNSINHSINRAITNDDINHLKTGMGITTINKAKELIKDSIDRMESLQKTKNNNQIDISIDSIIHESYYNALDYVFNGADKPALEKQATNDVKIFAIKQDIDLILFAIFSGILNLLKNLNFNLKYEFFEDNEVICIQIGVEVDNYIFILNEIDDEANIRAAKQLIQLKFKNSSISRSSSGEVVIKFSSNTKKVKIYLAIADSSLEGNLKHQINFIYKSRKENVIYTEDVEELGQVIITDDESKALSIANKGKKVFLITKGDPINNVTQSNIIYLSRNKIAMDDVMYGGTYLVNFLL
ncbi:MAG: GAF domain-containing protein [Thiolinea sp.]